MTTSSAAERVRAGMAFLDATDVTFGWDFDINLDQLDLSVCRDCVLGQIAEQNGWTSPERAPYDAFDDAIDFLGLSASQVVNFGFTEDVYRDPDYEVLTQVWRDVITERREAYE